VELDPCALTVIEGYVGQGKSVFLKQLALKWRQQTDQLLLYCELRGHRGRKAAEIVSAELSDVGHNIDASCVDAFLQQHPALLLWDGFDELSVMDRVPLLAQLHSWKRRSPNLGIILATRPGTEAHYSSPANVYSMAELEHADFLPVSRHLAPDRPPEELSRMLVGDRLGIRDLMTTPAMIAGILRHFRADRPLRENTLAFYKDVFEYIAWRQNESAFGTRRPLTCGWDYPVLQSFFETFAFLLYQRFGREAMHLSDLRKVADAAARLIDPSAAGAAALQDVLQLSNLLLERDGVCRFLHPSIGEYYAAEFIARQPHREALTHYRQLRSRWRHWEHVLSFLADLDSVRMAVYFDLPELEPIASGDPVSYLGHFESFIIRKTTAGRDELHITEPTTYSTRFLKVIFGSLRADAVRQGAALWCPQLKYPLLEPGQGVKLPKEHLDLPRMASWLGDSLSAGVNHCQKRLRECRVLQDSHLELALGSPCS
ncbi:MAG: NACHT domain-containing protein, partial [Planctomycetaceae bacterium]